MKKLFCIMVLGLLLANCDQAKDTKLLCDDIAFTLKSNSQKLIREPTITKMLKVEYRSDAIIYDSIFENDKVYIFSYINKNTEHPNNTFYMLDRSTLKLYFKLYWLNGRILFGERSPAPPTNIRQLVDDIHEQDVVKQCTIDKPKI